jgi:aldose 1-epimerase
MEIKKRFLVNTKNGLEVDVYTLSNSKGMEADILSLGGIVYSLRVPDRNGTVEDIVLGYNDIEDYLKPRGAYYGAIVGRHANRIGNASFELNGIEYKVTKNEGENQLHGGLKGFDKVVWQAEVLEDEDENEKLQLSYTSKDGEEGYPGNLQVKVTYSITEDNELKIEYYAVSDKDTVVNLTNHSYFNLSGQPTKDVLKHKVMINADSFTVNDSKSLPTGEILEVKGTPMDFTSLTEVGKNIDSDYEQIVFGAGYDHNYVLNTKGDLSKLAAEIVDEESGRVIEVYTTKPGVQLYTGNFLNDTELLGKNGIKYIRRCGLCLETQYFPNSLKHKNFPSPILRTGEEYKHVTIYKAGILK